MQQTRLIARIHPLPLNLDLAQTLLKLTNRPPINHPHPIIQHPLLVKKPPSHPLQRHPLCRILSTIRRQVVAAVNLELEAVQHVACDVDLDTNVWVGA